MKQTSHGQEIAFIWLANSCNWMGSEVLTNDPMMGLWSVPKWLSRSALVRIRIEG